VVVDFRAGDLTFDVESGGAKEIAGDEDEERAEAGDLTGEHALAPRA
jgi:hypothetical protein